MQHFNGGKPTEMAQCYKAKLERLTSNYCKQLYSIVKVHHFPR